jgi:hypothetical protein
MGSDLYLIFDIPIGRLRERGIGVTSRHSILLKNPGFRGEPKTYILPDTRPGGIDAAGWGCSLAVANFSRSIFVFLTHFLSLSRRVDTPLASLTRSSAQVPYLPAPVSFPKSCV